MVKHDTSYKYIRPGQLKKFSDWALPIIIFVGALVLYIKTMAPSVFWGDLDSFQANNYLFGPDHSTPFPLYSFLIRVVGLIPGLGTLFSSNLMSALFTALAVMLFYFVVKSLADVPVFQKDNRKLPGYQKLLRENPELQQSRTIVDIETISQPALTELPALAAAILFTLSLPVWLTAVRANVYSLQLALTMAALLFALDGVRRNQSKLYFLGLWFYALTFANYPLMALAFAPAFIYLILINITTTEKKWAGALAAVLLLAASLTVYFYLPVQATIENAMAAGGGQHSNLLGSMGLSSETVTTGTVALGEQILIRLQSIGHLLVQEIGWPLIGFMIIGLWGLARLSRRVFFFFPPALLCFLALIVFSGDFDPRSYNLAGYLAPLIGMVILIAVTGTLYLLRTVLLPAPASNYIAVFVAVFAVTAAYDNHDAANMSQVVGPELLSEHLLKDMPPGALLVVHEKDLVQPLWHHAYVDSAASQVHIIAYEMLGDPIYRGRIKSFYPDLSYPDNFDSRIPESNADILNDICRLNYAERPVCLQCGIPGLQPSALAPSGLLFRYDPSRHSSPLSPAAYRQHLKLAQSVIENNPRELRTVDIMGNWLFELGAYVNSFGATRESGNLFDLALSVDMANVEMRGRLATILAEAGKYKEALKQISDALAIDPDNPEIMALGRRLVEKIARTKTVVAENGT